MGRIGACTLTQQSQWHQEPGICQLKDAELV
jgi:hypothetical protein